FQAEDGIRDKLVTGVQTCALPISASPASQHSSPCPTATRIPWPSATPPLRRCGSASPRQSRECHIHGRYVPQCGIHGPNLPEQRSEERRVGKECRSWGVQCEYAEG